MYKAWVIQQVCGGTSPRWKGGEWRRRDCSEQDSASRRSRARSACIASRSAAGLANWKSRAGADCAKPSASVGRPSSVRPSSAISNARSGAAPRPLASAAGFGAPAGCATLSSNGPECDTTKTTCGASCASSTGVASALPDARWNATSRRLGAGRSTAGRSLKKALLEGRTIVFVDESGLSERPHRVRTWAPRGQTPLLQYHFNWKVLSVAAGITWWNFYFRLYRRTIRGAEVTDFLGHLLRHLPGKLLVGWDGLAGYGGAGLRSLSPANRAGWKFSHCRPLRQNSIRWSISGA